MSGAAGDRTADSGPSAPAPDARPTAPTDDKPFRFLVEFTLLTAIAVTVVRSFVAETYMVPSGSMANVLLGHHKDVRCPGCGYAFAVGIDDSGHRASETSCPNCLYPHIELEALPIVAGDRLLVQKGLFDFRAPVRWEPVVFRHPHTTREAWIKRVVGLPGESVEIVAGDVYIDGRIARKDWRTFLACRIPVYDSAFAPADPAMPLPARLRATSEQSGWRVDRGRLSFMPVHADAEVGADRIEYIHRDRGAMENFVRDELPYNADQPHWLLDPVTDLAVAMHLEFADPKPRGVFRLGLRIAPELEVVAVIDRDRALVLLEGSALQGVDRAKRRASAPWGIGPHVLELGIVDRAIWFRMDGVNTIGPVELDGRRATRRTPKITSSRPVYLESTTALSVPQLRIDRDIHYSGRVEGAVHASAIGRPCQLGPAEYFVLGDNSPISRDSRAWDSPGVPSRLLIGKPILAHRPPHYETATLWGRRIRKPAWPFGNLRLVR